MHVETNHICFQKEKDSNFKIIAILVVILHAFFLSLVAYNQTHHPAKKLNQKLVVKTINLKPAEIRSGAKEMIAENHEVAEVAKTPVNVTQKEMIKEPEIKKVETVKKETSFKKEEQKKTPVKKIEPVKLEPVKKVEPNKKVETVKKIENKKLTTEKPTLKPQQEVKVKPKAPEVKVDEKTEAMKVKQRELMAAAQQNLAKIDKTTLSDFKKNSVKSTSNATLEQIGALNVDAFVSMPDSGSGNVRELSYRDELAHRLKTLLKLPEHGEVKIKLTLDRLGHVIKLMIVSAESKKNRQYIDNHLKTLTFPSFQGIFQDLPDYTFSITLK